jgi:TolB-like protein/DNA-binding winged helix-turn-helix (wHTH) protein/Flp pilus assembly protein TadD
MGSTFHVGPWLVEPELNSISRDGQRSHLEPKAMEVLLRLASRAGETVSKEQLIQAVWADTFVGDDVLSRAIYELRKAFQDNTHEPHYIQTIPKRGYRLIAPVDGMEPAAPPAGAIQPEPGNRRRRWIALSLVGAILLASAIVLLIALNVGRLRERVLGRADKPRIESLAVLPMKNFSGDPAQEYFADGMTDALIASLSQIKDLKRVATRTSVMQYKDAKKSLPQIAKELGVDGIVEASVMRSGSRVRITVQLIEARQDRHRWAKTYDREMTDVLALQSELVQAIAGEIRAQLTPQEKQRLANARPVNPEAYDLCLRGSYFRYKDDPEGFQKAIEYFQRAVDLDATYAPAYAGLSEAYSTAGLYSVLPYRDVLPKAKVAAKRALELDESLAEAHTALGIMNHYDRDWTSAEREFKRALELAPNNMLTHTWYGKYLTDMGRFDEAIAVRRRAVDLDPLSIQAKDMLGYTLYYAGHYDESIRQYLQLIEMDPRNAYYYMWLSGDYLAIHASAEAIAACRKALELGPEDQAVLTLCGHNLALLGRRQEALALLHRVQALSAKNPVDPCLLALLYVGLGDKERALGLLERAFEEHSPNMTQPAPDFPQLASEPRFQDLLRRMNLPQ